MCSALCPALGLWSEGTGSYLQIHDCGWSVQSPGPGSDEPQPDCIKVRIHFTPVYTVHTYTWVFHSLRTNTVDIVNLHVEP